jgi:hypothetical protein
LKNNNNKMKKKLTLILTILVDLHSKNISHKSSWLNQFKRSYVKFQYNANTWNREKTNKGIAKFVIHIWTFAFTEIGPSHHFSPRCWCHDEHWVMISIKKTNVMFNIYMVLRLMKDQEHKTYFFIIVHIRLYI